MRSRYLGTPKIGTRSTTLERREAERVAMEERVPPGRNRSTLEERGGMRSAGREGEPLNLKLLVVLFLD